MEFQVDFLLENYIKCSQLVRAFGIACKVRFRREFR